MTGIVDPTLEDVVQTGVNAALARLHVALPGRVLKFDASNDTADIELQVSNLVEDDDGFETAEDYPTLPSVPIAFPRSATFILRWPVSAGDRVMVVCASQAIDNFLATGNKGNPGDNRRHDLSHAIAYPGLYPVTEVDSESGRDANLILGRLGGTQIQITPSEVHLAGAADFLARADRVDAELKAITDAFNMHAHTGVTTGMGTSGTPAMPMPAPGATKSDKVKGT